MNKKLAVLLSATMLCTTLFATGVSAKESVDEALTIEHVDVATGEVSHYTVQADEDTPTVLPGFVGNAPIRQDTGIEPYNVIGPDNRYEVKNPDQIPYRFICYTVTTFNNDAKRYGTGFMIWPNKMVTSAYNLYDPSYGRAKRISVAPAQNGKDIQPYSYATSTSFEYPSNYVTTVADTIVGNERQYNLACVTLSTNLGSQCGYFNLRSIERSDSYAGKGITVAGYPADEKQNKPLYKLNKSAGKVASGDTAYLYYTIDTSYGQSGGPVYIEENGNYFAVGVHNYGSNPQNSARKFTPSVIEWLDSH